MPPMGEDTRRVAVLEHILGQIEATAGDDQSHLIIQLEKMLEQETTFKDRNAALVVREQTLAVDQQALYDGQKALEKGYTDLKRREQSAKDTLQAHNETKLKLRDTNAVIKYIKEEAETRNQQYRHQEQHLSSLRDRLVDLDLKQQAIQQQERSAIHAHWSDLVRERKELAEWKNGIDKAIEDSKLAIEAIVGRLRSSLTDSIAITKKRLSQDIATYNKLADIIDANAEGIRTFGDRIEAWKNQIHNLRDGLADDETSVRDTRELLTELDARLKTLHREGHSLQIKWASTPIHEDEALQFQSSRPRAPRKRDLNGSSTDTSPEKPSHSKRHQADSLSPVDERHASPVLARARVASNTPGTSRLPQASSSTQQQRVRPKLGPEELRTHIPAEWAANPSSAPQDAAKMMHGGRVVDTTVAVLDLPELLQTSWEQCTFDVEIEDQEALVKLFKAWLAKKSKPSEQTKADTHESGQQQR